MTAVAFMIAAALGGLVRWQGTRLNADGRPLGTLTANVAAAFAAGLASGVSATVAVVLTTAFLGATSTFSTVMAELVDLRESFGLGRSAAYGAVTCAAGVGAAAIGLSIAT